jgi:hypothetical protein
MQRTFIKKCFHFTLGSVCRVKRFTNGLRNSLKDEEIETEVRKGLTQQSEYFYAPGFDALAKRQDKFINVGGGNVQK